MTDINRFVFVLGAHRSGTSLVAGACDALGVHLGADFIAANEENPKGFFEDETFVRLNDRLLRSTSLSWDAMGYTWQEDFTASHYRPYHDYAVRLVRERFRDKPLAGMKDPRLCLLLPFWRRVIIEALDADIYYLLTIREPGQCANSQKARNISDDDFHLIGKRREHVLLLWATYMHHVLRGIEAQRSLVLAYDSILANPSRELRRIATFLGVDVDAGAGQGFAESFVEPSLNRSSKLPGGHRENLPEVWQWTGGGYGRLLQLAGQDTISGDDIQQAIQYFDLRSREGLYLRETQHMYGYAYKKVLSLRHRLIRCIGEIGESLSRQNDLQAECDRLGMERERLQHECDTLESRIQEILDSKAWKFILRLRSLKAAVLPGSRRGES